MKVRLFTKDGGFVHEQEIPPFNDAPDVIIWGLRMFVGPNIDGPVSAQYRDADDTYVYEEAFAYALVPERTRDLP
jgi:hypothetical protein